MATQDHAASIQGVAIRLTRLESSSALVSAASGSYVQNTFISMKMTPEFEAGEEINQKGADGLLAVTFKSADVLKRITLELAIPNPDPEFEAMLCGGQIFTDALGQSVGYSPPAVGATPPSVAIEVWAKAITNGKIASVNPYWHWVLPLGLMRPSGDRTIENGLMANVYQGYGVGNTGFGHGPDGSWPFGSDRPYQYARSSSAPLNLTGYQTSVYTPNDFTYLA
jgi:hypothetical protein